MFRFFQGDSGGPLICTIDGPDFLVGLISRGKREDCPSRLTIVTNVVNNRDWVLSIINRDDMRSLNVKSESMAPQGRWKVILSFIVVYTTLVDQLNKLNS